MWRFRSLGVVMFVKILYNSSKKKERDGNQVEYNVLFFFVRDPFRYCAFAFRSLFFFFLICGLWKMKIYTRGYGSIASQYTTLIFSNDVILHFPLFWCTFNFIYYRGVVLFDSIRLDSLIEKFIIFYAYLLLAVRFE